MNRPWHHPRLFCRRFPLVAAEGPPRMEIEDACLALVLRRGIELNVDIHDGRRAARAVGRVLQP